MTLLPEFEEQELELRPTIMDVDLSAVRSNFKTIDSFVGMAEVMPILKANAYGHGLVECALELEKENPWGFGVAFLEEAITLRKAGVLSPILALGGISGRQLDYFLQYDVDICASSSMKLETINQRAALHGLTARIHLKIDTGMERIGIHYYNAKQLFEKAETCSNCEVVGVFSHFADAENEDLSFSRLQLERFKEAISFYDNYQGEKPKFHMANSPAMLRLPDSILDMVRPGISLYGVSPFSYKHEAQIELKDTMTLRSEVVYFKVIPADVAVSYGLTWKSSKQTRIATIAAGYGDGYPRFLSNKGRVLIRGRSYPIVGRICMDQFMVDLGKDGEAYNGDEVVLIGSQGDERIGVREIAMFSDIDPRDIMLRVASRVPRRYLVA